MKREQIKTGSVVDTVSPTGTPNAHTARIGKGLVVDLYVGTAGEPVAHVKFFDGKEGSWPIENLRVR